MEKRELKSGWSPLSTDDMKPICKTLGLHWASQNLQMPNGGFFFFFLSYSLNDVEGLTEKTKKP